MHGDWPERCVLSPSRLATRKRFFKRRMVEDRRVNLGFAGTVAGSDRAQHQDLGAKRESAPRDSERPIAF